MSDAISLPTCPDDWLNQLYRAHFATVRNYLVRRLGCPEAGREAAQDVFLKLLTRPQWEPIQNPRWFLLRSARNLAIDQQRSESLRPACEALDDHADYLPDPLADPARIVEGRQYLQAVANGIENLPGKCREVFFLHRFDGLTQREIAGQCGISVKMVEAHLARAMLQLRRCWRG